MNFSIPYVFWKLALFHMDETMAHHSRSLANQASHAGEWVTSKNPLNAREFTAKF
jgi:hypothetical protein